MRDPSQHADLVRAETTIRPASHGPAGDATGIEECHGALYVVHEMNQPLTAIRTNGETALRWLANDPPDVDKARMSIERIVRNSSRAADLIRSFRRGVRQAAAANSSFIINDIIRELLDVLSRDMHHGGIAVETDLAEDLEAVTGDREQIERVLANLITNAIEAMSAVQGRSRRLRVSTKRGTGGGALISVEDSGEGLDPADIDRVFEPFFTTKRDGMGLGLAICRSIVEAHGGRLWAAPTLPHGSIFRFSIPAGSR